MISAYFGPLFRSCSLLFFATAFSLWPGFSWAQVGSPDTFDIATWNIEWFGSNGNGPSDNDQQRENVRTVIEQSGIEFWALQEISDSFQFNRLVDSLGTNWIGQLATISGQQHIGYLYNTDVVREGRPIHILTDKDFAGRPPLRMTIDVSLPDTTVSITLITVHMKAFGGSDDRDRREEGAFWLKNHMDFALPADRPIILLGDLNDELRFSISGARITPYQNFLDDPANYFFATTEIDANREFTWCGSNSTCSFGSTLDHILISNELFNKLIDNRAYRLDSVLDTIPGFVNNTSDHIPVYARFVFSTATATEEIAESPNAFRIRSAYPNPARSILNVEMEGVAGRPVLSVEIFDVLGRKIGVPQVGSTTSATLRLDTSRLAPGLYILRLSNGRATDTVRFMKER